MSIWEFINPGDAYDKGYAYGLADGKGGKRKNAPWQEEIKYATALFNREHFWKSFHEGYNTGYTDGLRVKNQVFTENNLSTTNINSSKNMDPSYEYQYALLSDLQKMLGDFTLQLDQLTADYMSKVGELKEAGLMNETFRRFQNQCLLPTMTKVKNLTEQLAEHDLKLIQTEMDKIETLL